jgi:Ni,Fe-hydrogenase III large subunit
MSGSAEFAKLRNATSIPLGDVPRWSFDSFRRAVLAAVADGARVSALFGDASDSSAGVDLCAVLADEAASTLHVARTFVEGDQFESLTPDCPQVHIFEREIAEQFSLRPVGHPWLKPVRFHRPFRAVGDKLTRSASEERGTGKPHSRVGSAWPSTSTSAPPVIGVTDFYRVEGEEVHEVAVGPVHAGVIEPGHFRFQCHGEHVFHLEISLGYQHRGVERALVGGPDKRTIHTMETLAGDTSIGHAIAYCQSVESLARRHVPARAEVLRGIALELERLANHTGDLGALAGDVGYLPTASFCGRLRGDFLNATAAMCGSRFGRGMVRPGGVGFDVADARVADLLKRMEAALPDVTSAANLLWESPSVMARFEETGRVSRESCNELGLVGPAARACGIERDVRHQFPAGIFQFAQVPISTADTGDVFARAFVRWLEIQRSIAFVREQLESLPNGPVREPIPVPTGRSASGQPSPLTANHLAVSLVEGWRGEICHVAITDDAGRFRRYKVVDPSFHNWTGLAMALRDQQVSDFPLCNKSFNLSYCGFDL